MSGIGPPSVLASMVLVSLLMAGCFNPFVAYYEANQEQYLDPWITGTSEGATVRLTIEHTNDTPSNLVFDLTDPDQNILAVGEGRLDPGTTYSAYFQVPVDRVASYSFRFDPDGYGSNGPEPAATYGFGRSGDCWGATWMDIRVQFPGDEVVLYPGTPQEMTRNDTHFEEDCGTGTPPWP